MAGFSSRLKDLRIQNKLSQQELADKIHVTKQTISQYERGVREPDYDYLLALCDIFNVSVDYILGKADVTARFLTEGDLETLSHSSAYYTNPETAQIAQQIFEDSDMRILFDAARDSKPEDLQMAADLLKRLKGTNPNG